MLITEDTMDISLKGVPKKLINEIDNLAKVNRRSRNAQIIMLLETMTDMILDRLEKDGNIIREGDSYKLTEKGKAAVADKLKEW